MPRIAPPTQLKDLERPCVAIENQCITPEKVADALIDLIKSKKRRRFIGFPETLFARINGAFPSLVDNAIAKQLPKIKSFFAN